jgi:uncharacterized membrane protein
MVKKDISPTRLEAFSDGVIAIIITIMVLELKIPHETMPAELLRQWPVFFSYALSYFMVAIYWINHHHLIHYITRVDTRILWANMLLLFCVSLIPFFTAYMGENHMTSFATALYVAELFICGFAFLILLAAVGRHFRDDEDMRCFRRAAIFKNVAALALYTIAAPAAYYHPALAFAITFVVAIMYVLPNAWLEKKEDKNAIHH